MLSHFCKVFHLSVLLSWLLFSTVNSVSAADKLTGLHSAQVMSQSMP